MQSIESHDDPGQVQGFEQRLEVGDLVVFDVDLDLVKEPAGMLADSQKMNPGTVPAAGAAAALAVHSHRCQTRPTIGQ
jgi:hypothetical protein